MSLRPCWTCRQPVLDGRCPQHPRIAPRRPDYHYRNRRYGRQHSKIRAALLTTYMPGQPCALCHQPMTDQPALLDLAHGPGGHGYAGLAHQACNRNTSEARKRNRTT